MCSFETESEIKLFTSQDQKTASEHLFNSKDASELNYIN